MKNSLLLIAIVLCPVLALSQQLAVSARNGVLTWSHYNAFDKHFLHNDYMQVYFYSADFYKARKIKKIELINNDKSIFWQMELDTSGRTVQLGRAGLYYFITEQKHSDSHQSIDTVITSYFLQTKLMRIDTEITTRYSYHHADTTISFDRIYTINRYNGALLDEQNAYYNEHYLNKKLSQQQYAGAISITRSSKKETHIYLHKRLKTDYDSSKLYLNKIETKDVTFIASIDSGKRGLGPEQLKKHPFVKQFQRTDHKDCFTSGSDFVEPHFYYETYICGTGMHQMQERVARTSYGYSSNKDGLYETYFSTYHNDDEFRFPPDTARKSATLERTVLLRFQYEYFQ
jgi:hypothetical protein